MGEGDLYVRKSSFCAKTGGTPSAELIWDAIAWRAGIGGESCATVRLGDSKRIVGDCSGTGVDAGDDLRQHGIVPCGQHAGSTLEAVEPIA